MTWWAIVTGVMEPSACCVKSMAIAWSPDGRTVIGVAGDYRVREWEPSTGTMLAAQGLGQRATAVQYTTDGSVLVGSDQGELTVMDAKTLAVRGPPTQVLHEAIAGLALDRTSHTVLVEGATQHILVDYLSGRRLSTLPDVGFFSPDGNTLAVVDSSGGVGFRATSDLHWVARPDPTHAYGGPSSSYSHDGAWFASSRDGHVGLWDTRTGSSVGSVTVPQPVAVGFSADDNELVIAGLDGSVLTWDMRTRSWVTTACAIAGRDLTATEWSTALPGRPPQQLCPATEWNPRTALQQRPKDRLCRPQPGSSGQASGHCPPERRPVRPSARPW